MNKKCIIEIDKMGGLLSDEGQFVENGKNKEIIRKQVRDLLNEVAEVNKVLNDRSIYYIPDYTEWTVLKSKREKLFENIWQLYSEYHYIPKEKTIGEMSPPEYLDMIRQNIEQQRFHEGMTEEHFGKDKEEHVIDSGVNRKSLKTLGQPKKALFITTGTANEENVVVKNREAERMKKYVKEHHMSGKRLNTRMDDTLNKIIVAFLKRWKDSKLIGEQLPGSAVFRFLTEDVGLESEVSCESFAAKVKTFVEKIDVSVQTDREVGASFEK